MVVYLIFCKFNLQKIENYTTISLLQNSDYIILKEIFIILDSLVCTMLEVKFRCPDCDEVFYVHVTTHVHIVMHISNTQLSLREHIEDCRPVCPSVHVHRPPAVTLNETARNPIFPAGYVRRFKSNLLRKVSGHEH